MASKRRYQPIAKYPIYSKHFDKLRMQSNILNEESRPSMKTVFWSKDTLKAELVKIVGSYIPALDEKLSGIDFQFEDLQTECRNSGREIPIELPLSLQNQKYQIEAEIDVALEEKTVIQEKIKTYTDKAEKEDTTKILQYGLRCAGSFHGIGTNYYQPDIAPAMLDGQRLELLTKEKILIIAEPSSKYLGMSVVDYRRLAKQWQSDRMKDDEKLLLQLQKEAKENGLPRPNATGRSMSCTISKSNLPKWPEGVKNWKSPDVEEPTLKRKPKVYADSKKI